ncbi:pyruvate synthase subunit beta [bacterium]|nr:pyruvate synthase subunit beta [bacterium]
MVEPLRDHKNYHISPEEIMSCGHLACPGCGAAIIMRHALKVFGRKTIMTMPACCWAVIDGPFPYSTVGIPLLHAAFETTAISASGIRAGLDVQGIKGINVVGWAGDGATFDIGFGALSAAAERNENIIYVCYDNEAYMNTGIQRSSATPWGAWTTTTPINMPKSEPKKNLVEIMAAHKIPYAATATIAYPDDLRMKLEKARDMEGFRLLHIFSPCPPGHKMAENMSIKESRLIVQSRVFPLYEVEYGKKYRLTVNPPPVPVEKYLEIQGRFKHLDETAKKKIQADVDEAWETLMGKVNPHAPAARHQA